MKVIRRNQRGTLISIVVVTAIIALLTVLAISDPGVAVRRVALNDSGIWVTKNDPGHFGRYNKIAGKLDTAIGNSRTGDLDVRQDRSAVVVRDNARAVSVDVRRGVLSNANTLNVPDTSPIEMGGGTLARLDLASGKVWATRYADDGNPVVLAELDPAGPVRGELGPSSTTPAAGTAPAALTVSTSGTVFAVSITGKLMTISPTEDGFGAPQFSQLDLSTRSVQISAVGELPVVLEAAEGRLWIGDKAAPLRVTDPAARLQSPSGNRRDVLVATASALLAVPVSGDPARSLVTIPDPRRPAIPVQVGACGFAAWDGAPPAVAQSCDGAAATMLTIRGLENAKLTDPKFRVNRDQILLNDDDGVIVDVEARQRVDDWDALTKVNQNSKSDRKSESEDIEALRSKKPEANDDPLGARPGRTTVLHVLDNDSDPAGRILTAEPVTQPKGGAKVVAAPDGQTLLYTMPRDGRSASFTYKIDNGQGGSATAEVSIEVRSPEQNAAPVESTKLKPKTIRSVVAGGSISLPALAHWRDDDGDPVSYAKSEAAQGMVVTSGDRLELTAPDKAGLTKINYWVTDGADGPGTPASVDVTVLPADSDETFAPIAEPDVVSGIVGRPIIFQPLANDVPGTDPTDSEAALMLAGNLSSKPGLKVTTDLETGKVSAEASRPGSFVLSYTAAFGSAELSKPGQIRVNVKRPPDNAEPPIAVPDDATVHDRNPIVVDVLANDVDPAGSVLTVESVKSDDPSEVEVSVIRGRWLRILPLRQFAAATQRVQYKVTNGQSRSDGTQVTVTQLDAVDPDPPVTRADYGVVRAGDAISIPVLENDSTEGRAPLSLQTNIAGNPQPGRLLVSDLSSKAGQPTDSVGTAYASSSLLRYVPPATIAETRTVSVDYVAQTDAGLATTGTAYVTIIPATPEDNHAPTPEPIEARAVAGQTIKIPVRSSGQDADGDSISVAGVTGAPALGRVIGFSPTGITYQAFPTSAGTDSFGFLVVDRYGATTPAIARVSVTQPREPQPVVAVADTVTGAPGAKVRVNLITNDLVDPGDTVTALPLARTNTAVPAGVTLDEPSTTLEATAPRGDSQVVAYAIRGSAGGSSRSNVTIRSQEDFNNPPVAYDQVAKITAPGSAEADVLGQSWDADGPTSDLTLKLINPAAAQVSGSKIIIPVTESSQVIAYEVTDAQGAAASAVVYVPGTRGGPYAQPDKTIEMGINEKTRVALADYIVSPRNQPISVTTASQQWASPATVLSLKSIDSGTIELESRSDYTGPAAITLEVTDSPTISDPLGKSVVTIPVQIGPAVPVLRCPTGVLRLVEGGEPLELSIASYCHVWTADPNQVTRLTYTAEWETGAPGVTVAGMNTATLTVTADSEAREGDVRLRVGVSGSDAEPATLQFVVVAPGDPNLAPVKLDGIKQGTTAKVDVAAYLSSPLRDPQVTVVGVEPRERAAGSKIDMSGSTVSITPPNSSSGVLTYDLVAADVADVTRTGRQARGTIALQVYGRPDAPGRVQATAKGQSRTATVSWRAGGDNGAPITEYRVKSSTGVTQTCAASPCQIRGLKNGAWVTFTVEARNKAGWSKVSESTNRVRPDAPPPAVIGLRASKPADHNLTLTWTAPVPDGTPITKYRISWPGHAETIGARTTFKAEGLDNNVVYSFTVKARNEAGFGKPVKVSGQSSGKPSTPTGVKATGEADPTGSSTPVTVTWNDVDPNGPGPVTYAVTRTGPGGNKSVCTGVASTRCVDDGVTYDGSSYRYQVTATNKTGGPAHTSAAGSKTFQAVGKPDSWGSWSAEATGEVGQVRLTYRVPNSRGKESRVIWLDGGSNAGSISGDGSDTVTVSNGNEHRLQLRVCNEKDNCSVSDSQTVTPYGPFENLRIDGSANGPTINYTVAGNANGLRTRIIVNGQHVDDWTGNESYPGSTTPGYGKTVTIVAETSDDKRPRERVEKTFRTNPAPLQVRVMKGSDHRIPSCTSVHCKRVRVIGDNFTPNATVRVVYSSGCETYTSQCRSSPAFPNRTFTTDGNGHFDSDGPNVFGFPGSTVTVTVTNLSDSRQASATTTW